MKKEDATYAENLIKYVNGEVLGAADNATTTDYACITVQGTYLTEVIYPTVVINQFAAATKAYDMYSPIPFKVGANSYKDAIFGYNGFAIIPSIGNTTATNDLAAVIDNCVLYGKSFVAGITIIANYCIQCKFGYQLEI